MASGANSDRLLARDVRDLAPRFLLGLLIWFLVLLLSLLILRSADSIGTKLSCYGDWTLCVLFKGLIFLFPLQLIMTGVAVLVVDRLGRRPLLIGGVSGIVSFLNFC
ncbi:hypothetical protein B296_00024077 [Ensete ventricosum]|uniref:Uncharacterized protein n=1 Tax=Ensete ventricosum TaxID=4639 RepID=A0A427AU31_ENSVE|nr:hypothetical protein B296_00024077 [Ensete ventricosum]